MSKPITSSTPVYIPSVSARIQAIQPTPTYTPQSQTQTQQSVTERVNQINKDHAFRQQKN